MDWDRGLFRLWIILALAWVTIVGAILLRDYVDCIGQVVCFADLIPPPPLARLAIIVLPPAALFAVGAVLRWVVRGF